MKAEFEEGIAYLERWYTWRDKQTDERYGEVYNNGWMHNILCPDELRTYKKYEHGQRDNTGQFTYIYQAEIYRYDLFQWEDAMRGNGDCVWDKMGKCGCYPWPGAIHTLEWTDKDERRWLDGGFYPQTECALRDSSTHLYLYRKYGHDPYGEMAPNDVVLVIEEGDNADHNQGKKLVVSG